ncbi:MAG: ABC transporter ATP-binding protein [Gemmatimonadaceae bacterium]
MQIDGLTKRFSARPKLTEILRAARRSATTVVDHVSFDVRVGEIVGVLGPNGAGKTTIFKMLSTMVLPDDGTASVCGNDIWLEPGRVRAALAAVSSDERSLNWRLSARENLRLFAVLHRVEARAVEQRVTSLLEQVGLAMTGTKMVGSFSSGMRQRLLIARALLSQPSVLLLDEPTRALDPISAQEFRVFLRKELIERQRATILLATHNAEEALGFCDRVIVLDRGRVLAVGTAAELKARFAEERYRLVVRDPQHPCFDWLETTGLLRRLSASVDVSGGWSQVDCAIAADPADTARVVRLLLDNGVDVARLERVEPSLADLIGRIIGAQMMVPANA